MILMNGKQVHEAVMQCNVAAELHRNGASHYVLPGGTVHLRLSNGKLKMLDCPVALSVRCYTERGRKLYDLLKEPLVLFWTMRDFCYALNVPHTNRWCGEIGKELKALDAGLKRIGSKKVPGLIDPRTKEPMRECKVYFCRLPELAFSTRPRDIRRVYRRREHAAELLRVCQQMRSRG